jgi:V8-like Glu-specific endopeptidase
MTAVPLSPESAVAIANLLTIDGDKSRGSAFRLSNGAINYLVTAKHVVFNAKEILHGSTAVVCAYDPTAFELDPLILSIDLEQAVIHRSSNQDVVAIEIGKEENAGNFDEKYQTKLLPYVSVVQSGAPGTFPVPLRFTQNLTEVALGDPVFLAGYPTSLGMKDQDYYDFSRPLLRSGVIAGKNAKKRTFVIDCPSYPGNSGSPVVARLKNGNYRVVGVVSQYIPFETRWYSNRERIFNTEISNSGYTVCVAMEAVSELLPVGASAEG